MTHDTPDGTDDRRVWCAACELSVVPTADGTCPACDRDL